MRFLGLRATRVLALLLLPTVSCDTATGPDRKVVSVVVAGSSSSLAPTATRQLTAVAQTAVFIAIPGKVFTWSSLNPGVASVTSTGLVTAVSVGTTTIRAVTDGVQGDYHLTVWYPACSPSTISGTISVGQTRTGAFSETGCQRFGIGPQAGWSITVATETYIRFELSTVAAQSSLEITNAAMDFIASSSSSEFGVPVRFVTVLDPGTYYVWADARGAPAPYVLQATAVTFCGPSVALSGPIAVDQTVAGALTTSSCVLPHVLEGQGWSFTLTENSPVRFDVVASGFQPWIVVTDAALNAVGVGVPTSATEATLSALLPAGALQVWVTTAEGGYGTFSLTRSVASITPCEVAPPVGAVAIGSSVNGILAATDCALPGGYTADQWTLTVAVSTTLQVDLVSDAFDAYLYLLDADGDVIAEDDDGGESVNSRLAGVFAAGVYTLRASSFSPGALGPYSLAVQQIPGVVAGGSAPGAPRKPRPIPSWAISPLRP